MEDDAPNKDADDLPTIEVADAPPEEKHHTPLHKEKEEAAKPSAREADIEINEDGEDLKPPKHSKAHRLKHWLAARLTKKECIAGAVALVLILSGGLVFGLSDNASAPKYTPAVKKAVAAKPTAYYSPLDGLPVTKAETTLPVTGVMIENSDFARPQSGLSQAGVVFEAIAEAGITRFLALYQEENPPNLGPIRSVRPYYLTWALGFRAAVAHVGGSPEALQDIQTWNVKDLSQDFYGSYYHRITTREAPHNAYTSMADLRALETSLGWTSDTTFTGFPRKAASPAAHPTATDLNFNISWSDYEIHYEYNAKDNAYLRWEAGVPQTDANTGKQLEPKVVIAIIVPYSLEADGYHSKYGTIGSGTAYVFQDGTVVVGKWQKLSKKGQITFTRHGQTIKLDPGQTWITALGSASEVSYKD
jgi:hypothetical protein